MKSLLKKVKGFTVMELMVIVAIIGIVIAIVLPFTNDINNSKWSPISGWTEVTCEGGYKFVRSVNGMKQIFDEHGRGIRCAESKS